MENIWKYSNINSHSYVSHIFDISAPYISLCETYKINLFVFFCCYPEAVWILYYISIKYNIFISIPLSIIVIITLWLFPKCYRVTAYCTECWCHILSCILLYIGQVTSRTYEASESKTEKKVSTSTHTFLLGNVMLVKYT